MGIEGLFQSLGADAASGSAFSFTMLALMLAYFFIFQLAVAVYAAMIRNHLMGSLFIDEVVSFKSNVEVLPFAWLMMTNALMLVLYLRFGFSGG